MINQVGEVTREDFPKLEVLDLSYNSISAQCITNLYCLKRLKKLDLSANSLAVLPPDLNCFTVLEELNLSSNMFTSKSTIVSP
jgi:Leucine-rich repeat (LRR) protein